MGIPICVFCSSSSALERVFYDVARDLGLRMGQAGHTLVFGGGNIGLMGALAAAAQEAGARIEGVIPEALRDRGLAWAGADEMIVTPDMRTRKQTMEARARAFLCLPGGFGTLEETLEILTLKQLNYHNWPIALLNVHGCFDPLLAQFEVLYAQRFVKEACRTLYRVCASPAEALAYIEAYRPGERTEKWFAPVEEGDGRATPDERE